MFTYILGGKIGEFMAPRPCSSQEIWSLLKSGLFDKVLNEFKKPGHQIEINVLDTVSGMAIIHYVCAGGAMELLVELLSQGADIAVPSSDGNNALHFAALNERKGIVEILLRSGADPSVPNHLGLLPIELSQSPEVSELFLRDRSNIFSPMATIAQSRVAFSELAKQQDISSNATLGMESLSLRGDYRSPAAALDPASSAIGTNDTVLSTSNQSELSESEPEGDSGKMPVFDMREEFEDEGPHNPAVFSSSSGSPGRPPILPPSLRFHSSTSSHTMVGVSTPVAGRGKQQQQTLSGSGGHHRTRSGDSSGVVDTFSDSGASLSDEPGDYTIVGVSSMHRPTSREERQAATRPLLRVDPMDEGDEEEGEEEDDRFSPRNDSIYDENHSSSSITTGGRAALSGVPKLNFSTLGPPPIDAHSTVNTYSLSARTQNALLASGSNGPFPSHHSNPVVGPPPTVVNHSAMNSARRGSGGSNSSGGHNIEMLVSVPPLQQLHTGLHMQQPAMQTNVSPLPHFYSTTTASVSNNNTSNGNMNSAWSPEAINSSSNHNSSFLTSSSSHTPVPEHSAGVSFSAFNTNNNRNQSLRHQQAQLQQMSTSYSSRKNNSSSSAHYTNNNTPYNNHCSSQSVPNTRDSDVSSFRHFDSGNNAQNNNSSSSSFSSPSTALTPSINYEADLQQDAEELTRAVMLAATETAMALQSSRDDYESRRLVIRNCQKLNEKGLRKLLTFDPSLSMCRSTELAALAIDGQTPLHVAAAFGNIDALRILFEMGGPNTTAWVRDMQGRTPLHLAAKGRVECAEYLREQMRAERVNRDPVGVHAPVDLAGTTPLGWAAYGSKGKPKSGVETSLFKAGDRSILPLTPYSLRAGKSPWKAALMNGFSASQSHNASGCASQFGTAVKEQQLGYYHHSAAASVASPVPVSSSSASVSSLPLVFAFSEASGWTPMMEDRVLICCPVAEHSGWSLFGVFDGHGGSFCSSYLAANIPSFFAQESSSLAIDADSATSETLTALLTNVCVSADRELSLQPRMAVERSEAGKISCMDSSGSTAVMVLVTDGLLAVSNVGDSRAVLAQRRAQPPNSRERTASGLSSCESSLPSSPSHVNRKQFFGGSGGGGAASPSPEAFKSSYATSSRDGQEKNESPQADRSSTPVTATPAAYHMDGSHAGMDHLTASIERLNPNLSTPTTVTPQHAPNNNKSAYSPIQYAQDINSGDNILTAVDLTTDHKAYLPEERARAEAAGAIVEQVPNSSAYQMSAKGSDVKLRMSRSFGDFYLKQNAALPSDRQAVVAVPEVRVLERSERDAFAVLACDGIFDVMTNQEVVDFVQQQIGFDAHGHPFSPITTSTAAEVCDALLAECLRRGTVDNLSVVLVVFATPSPSITATITPGGASSSSSNPYQYFHSQQSRGSAGQSSGHIAVQRRHSGTDHLARSGHSSEALHHSTSPQHMLSQYNAHHSLALRSPRDYSVDMPINSGVGGGSHLLSNSLLSSGGNTSIQNQSHSVHSRALNNSSNPQMGLTSPQRLLGGSLGGVFSHVDGDAQGVSSPLNTMAGSSRVRKQLQFHDS